MPQQLPPDELILTCSCSRLDHSVRFTFFPWGPHDKDTFEAYVDVCLDYERSWWGRLVTAIRYLFKRTCGYGGASEILIKAHDLPKLRAWMEKAERDEQKRRMMLQ
jgi:hypothetical protein